MLNLIQNPGFEQGTTGWLLYQITTQSTPIIDSTTKYNGLNSLRITMPPEGYGVGTDAHKSSYYYTPNITVTPNTEYMVSALAKGMGIGVVLGGEYEYPSIYINEFTSTGTVIKQYFMDWKTLGDYNWTFNKTSFITSPNAAYVYIYAQLWYSYGTLWVDDIYFGEPYCTPPILTVTIG